MRLNKIIYASAIVAASLATTGCSNWLDVNQNPNYPAEVPMEQLLPGIEVGTGYYGMAWDNLFYCGVYNQYFAQAQGASQFKSTERFENEDFAYTYRNYLTSVLSEAQRLKSGVSENSPYAMIAELISVFCWQNIVDTWGGVPYTEALNPTIFEPAFDKPEDIYADLIKRVDGVISNISAGFYEGAINGTYDFVFGGNLDNWSRFANSLKLKLAHRLSNTDAYNNEQLLQFVESSSFLETSAMIKQSAWSSKAGKMYPADEYANGGYFTKNVNASRSIVAYMEGDPRLEAVFTKVDGAVLGRLQGSYDTEGKYSQVNLAGIVKNIPLISVWEVDFDIAEVYLISGKMDKAKEYYEKAVAASFAYWNLSGQETIVTDGYAKWQDNKEEDFKNICLQRWASFLFTQHAEAFFEINRTGYPAVSGITEASALDDNFPKGMLIQPVCGTVVGNRRPQSLLIPAAYVQGLNSNAPTRQSDITRKIFWQK